MSASESQPGALPETLEEVTRERDILLGLALEAAYDRMRDRRYVQTDATDAMDWLTAKVDVSESLGREVAG